MEEEARYPVYRLLGKSGLRVHPLCLGTMTFGNHPIFNEVIGSSSSNDEAEQIILSYLHAGGNFIDTANFYNIGKSEEFITSVLEKNQIDRDNVVLATKYGLPMGPGHYGPNSAGTHKKSLIPALEDSLRRLNTSYIDLFYVHFWDWGIEIEELMRSLNDLVRAGKILHIGFSDLPGWLLTQANERARHYGWEPVTAYQGRYSLVDRALEQTVFPAAKYYNVGNICWGVVGAGKLTGRRTRENPGGSDVMRSGVEMSELDFDIQDVVIDIAKEMGRSPAQIAYRWAIQRPGVTCALVGARTMRHWEDNVKVMQFELDEGQMERLNQVSKNSPPLIFPNDWNGTSVQDCEWLQFKLPEEKKYTLE